MTFQVRFKFAKIFCFIFQRKFQMSFSKLNANQLLLSSKQMRYRLFGYRKFSIRYDIGLTYWRFFNTVSYRIVSEFQYFNRNFDIYIEFRYDIGSISYRIYFDIDINVDIVSYRIVSYRKFRYLYRISIKKISHLFNLGYFNN